MKIGWFPKRGYDDPRTHDARGITVRLVVGLNTHGVGVVTSYRKVKVHLGRVCIEACGFDQQVIEARIGAHMQRMESLLAARRRR